MNVHQRVQPSGASKLTMTCLLEQSYLIARKSTVVIQLNRKFMTIEAKLVLECICFWVYFWIVCGKLRLFLVEFIKKNAFGEIYAGST